MGPNRQRRPPVARRGRGRGQNQPTPVAATGRPAPSSMINNAGREMIIDVLHHAASGGNVPVPEKHFDANAKANITLHRNTPLTSEETLQRLFESLGFPRDLVSQYLADMKQANSIPAFKDVSELLAENSTFRPFLVQCCFELFNCMTWFSREDTVEEAMEKMSPEEGDEILKDELENIKNLFSDSFVGEKNFEDSAEESREIYFSFLTEDEEKILIAIRFPDYYPAETPSIFIQPQRQPLTSETPPLAVQSSCTKHLSATQRREIMDGAVGAINNFVGEGCLLPLVSSLTSTVACIKNAEETKTSPISKEEEIKQREERNMQRKAFVTSLTGNKAGQTIAAEGDEDEEERFIKVSMPEQVQLSTINDPSLLEPSRKEFLTRNTDVDNKLKKEWEILKKEGTLSATRQNLPAYLVREELRRVLKDHNVVVIGGETGSGKTTQIPQYLYEFMCEEGNGSLANIVCTQPRRLAATSVALRVAEERDDTIGGSVGYTIRLENCTSKDTKLSYCTTGIVLRRLQTDKYLGRVSHVVVDEIHERGVDTDFLLILLKDLIQRRPDLKIVLMSATMDSDLFSRYFGGAPTISIKGRTFPVQVLHLEQIIPATHYRVEDGSPYAKASTSRNEGRQRNSRKNMHLLDLDEAVEDMEDMKEQQQLASKIDASPETLSTISRMNLDVINYELIESVVLYIDTVIRTEGAVLIFLPGMAEIQKCMDQLKFNPTLSKSCILYNLHSSLGSSEQQGVFKRPPKGKRKVIIGTNIMETSITIDDAVFVIDSGKAKENRYNARKSLSELVTVNIAKANCKQRQGRAGRVREGYCFRLFTENHFNALEDHQLCEMHRVPLESLILQIYALHLGDEVEYLQKALSPPEERAIKSSVRVLKSLGALTAEKRLTSLGLHLANLPLDVRIGKMIIHGALLQCIDPVLTIAACLSTRSPFIASPDLRTEVENARRSFAGESKSDHLASWTAYNLWVSTEKQKGPAAARKLCADSYLSLAALQQIRSTKMQYERYLVEAGFLERPSKAGDNKSSGRTSSSKFIFQPHVTFDDRVYEAGGSEFNGNAGSSKCILACLVAGLYPNVATRKNFKKPKSGLSRGGDPPTYYVTFDGSECMIHPSSVACKATDSQFSHQSKLVVYVDKMKTSNIFLREVSFISPLHVILFGSGELQYVTAYHELCVDERTAFECKDEDASLLIHLKSQLDSALRKKINNPSESWESVSSVVVRAIVQLLRDEAGSKLKIIDRRQPRAPLTPLLVSGGESVATGDGTKVDPKPADQPFRTGKSCFICGEFGHVSRYCPHSTSKEKNKNSPPVRCFICGQWHFPLDCSFAKLSTSS